MEFAILRMVKVEPSSNWKAVYLAPHSAVVQEMLRSWSAKFGAGLRLKVTELTGDLQADLKVCVEQGSTNGPPERCRKMPRSV